MPCNTPRKKVQFLVENELVCQEPNNQKDELNYCNGSDNDDVFEAPPQVIKSTVQDAKEDNGNFI